jgi:hypothetical protein
MVAWPHVVHESGQPSPRPSGAVSDLVMALHEGLESRQETIHIAYPPREARILLKWLIMMQSHVPRSSLVLILSVLLITAAVEFLLPIAIGVAFNFRLITDDMAQILGAADCGALLSNLGIFGVIRARLRMHDQEAQ